MNPLERIEGRTTYAAVAVKISTLELVDDRSTNPKAKIAVKRAMRPRITPMRWTLARIVMAIVGRRQATTVVIIDVTRKIQKPEYSLKLPVMLFTEEALMSVSLLASESLDDV